MKTFNEKLAMVFITGVTNVACFPALYVLYKKKMFIHFHIGVFTFFTSFMYHFLDSMDWKFLLLERGSWHRLDNIGSIYCFIMLLVYWMDNLQTENQETYSLKVTTTDIHFLLTGLFTTLILQEAGPWKIENTVIPIFIYAVFLIIKLVFVRRSRFNYYYLRRGGLIMLIAIFFFVKGLDDKNDYLGIFHGMWHCCIGTSSFYVWQSIDKDREVKDVAIVDLPYQPRFNYKDVLYRLIFLNSTDNKRS